MLVMKFLSAILVLVNTQLIWKVNATYFYHVDHCARYYTACAPNRVLSMRSSTQNPYSQNFGSGSGSHDVINIRRPIDQSHPLLINVNVTDAHTGAVYYVGGPLNICRNYNKGSWERFAVNFFCGAMLPRRSGYPLFPVKPGQYFLNQILQTFNRELPRFLPNGQYIVSFTAQTPNYEIIFIGIRFLMSLTSN